MKIEKIPEYKKICNKRKHSKKTQGLEYRSAPKKVTKKSKENWKQSKEGKDKS